MAHAEIQESVARSKRSASCPDYNGDYLNNASLPQGLRSLSPFETHTTFDPLRYGWFYFEFSRIRINECSSKTVFNHIFNMLFVHVVVIPYDL